MTLREDLNRIAKDDPKSKAAEKAKSLGLSYVGFGRYEDPRSKQITHIVQNDNLVPYKRALRSNSFRTNNADDIGTYSNLIAPEIEELHNQLTLHYSPENYDDTQLDAIHTFTNAGYVDINSRLASLPTGVSASKIEPTNIDDRMANVISALDSALRKSRAPMDFITYTKLGQDVNIDQIKTGTPIRFKTFRNTSINLQTAMGQIDPSAVGPSGRPSIALLQIKVRKNCRGMYISDYSANAEDREFLLPRGATVHVMSGPKRLVGSDGMSQTMNAEILYFDCVLKS